MTNRDDVLAALREALSVDGVNEDDAPAHFGNEAAHAWVCGYEAGQNSITEKLERARAVLARAAQEPPGQTLDEGLRFAPPLPSFADSEPPRGEAGAPDGLTFATFSAANRARCEAPNGFNHALASWSLSDWFTAILGELGEAANVIKKLNRIRDGIPGNKQSEPELREMLRREIADAFIYLDLTAQAAGFTLADAVLEVFNRKSEEIGYPLRAGASERNT